MSWAANLTGGQKLFAFLSTPALSSLVIMLLSSDNPVKITILLVVCFALIFGGMYLALPTEARLLRLRKFSLYVALSASALILASQNLVYQVVASILTSIWPNLLPSWANQPSISTVPILVFLLSAIFIVNYLARDKTTMGIWHAPEKSLFEDPRAQKRLKMLCDEIKHKLDVIDQETRWQHTHYIPLEVDVDISKDGIRTRRVVDLLTGLRKERSSRLFVVLGDPGSGKSVALRRLCRELLGEAFASKRIPLYVNLKNGS